MRIIDWTVSMGQSNDSQSGSVEVEDNATDDEIEEQVSQDVFNVVSWGWSERGK